MQRPLLMGPNSAQQMSCEDTDNVASGKGRKRDRADQISSPNKREHFSKLDESEVNSARRESNMTPDDIRKVVGKDGGLNNIATVDQLIYLMQLHQSDKAQKPVDDVSWQTTLAGAIVQTDRDDCLSRFVQLGGLSILDEWLEEAQRGKAGDGGNAKDCGREVDEFFLIILCALEKLPIDSIAFKTCFVGKSVNSLCSHKNFEIQRRARKLVEAWKKQMDLETQKLGESKHRLNKSFPPPWKQLGLDFIELVPKGDLPHVEVGKLGSATFSTSNGAKENLFLASSPSVSDIPCRNICQVIINGPVSQSEQLKSAELDRKNDAKGILFISQNGMTSDSHPNDLVGKFTGACQTSSTKEAGFGKPSVWRKSVSIDKSINATSGSEKEDFEGKFLERSSHHNFIDGMASPRQSPVHDNGNVELIRSEESILDLPAPSSTSSSLNMKNGTPILSSDNAAGTGHQIHVSTSTSELLSVARGNSSMEAEQCSPLLRTGDCVDNNKKQIEYCSFQKPQESDQGDLKATISNIGTTWTGCPTDAEVQREEYLVTSSSGILLDSVFGRSHTSYSDLATVGINLLAIVAASESSAIDGTGSDIVASRSSCTYGGIVGKESKTGIFQNVDPMKREEKADNLDAINKSEAAGKTTDKQQWDGPHIPPETASLPTKLEGKNQYESDHIGLHKGRNESVEQTVNVQTGQCSGAATNFSKPLPLEAEVKAGFNSTSQEFASANESHEIGSSMFGIQCGLRQCQSSEEETVDKKNAWTAEPGYAFSRKKESDLKKPKSALTFVPEDALDVATPVVKEVEREMEDDHTLSPEEKGLDTKLAIDCTGGEVAGESISLREHPRRTSDGLEDRKWAVEPITQSLSITSVPLLNVEKNLDEKIAQFLDQSPVINLEIIDRGLRDTGCGDKHVGDTSSSSHSANHQPVSQNPASGCCAVTFVAVSSHQLLQPLPQCSQTPRISDQTVETVTFARAEAMGGYLCEKKHDFDLNEGLVEEAVVDDVSVLPLVPAKYGTGISSGGLASPIAVVTAIKGPFMLPANPLRTKGELGWKGSAATSAFRPAEPRRTSDRQTSASESLMSDVTSELTVKMPKPPLDFDLNIANEKAIEDAGTATASPSKQGFVIGMDLQKPSIPSGNSWSNLLDVVNGSNQSKHETQIPRRPILDLNCVDHSEDETNSASNSKVGQGIGLQHCSRKVFSTEAKTILDFDLNYGPSIEDADEPVQPMRGIRISGNIAPSCVAEAKINGEVVNVGQWPHSMIPFSAVSVPSFSPPRPEQPYQVAMAQSFSSGPSINQFHFDINQSSAALSSFTFGHPMPQPSAYSYEFPFGFNSSHFPAATSFLDTSASFMNSAYPVSFPAAVSSQAFSSTAVTPSHVQPLHVMGLTQVMGSSNDRAWARPNLDLNAGPGPPEADSRDKRSSVGQSLLGSLDGTRRTFHHVIEAGDARKELERGWVMQRPILNKHIWP